MRSIKSLEKGLQILEALSNYSDGARIKDISGSIADPISNISLFLNSMINVGFIAKDKNSGRYYITQKVVEIARKAEKTQYLQLKQAALLEMEQLRDELNENVLLAVLDGHDIHFIETFHSHRSVQVRQNQDVYYPPHVTAAGKAILAFLSPEKQERYLAEALYHKFTQKSLMTPSALRQELDTVKVRGYSVNKGEFESEIMAVGCPITSHEGVLGSVVVQFPTFRYHIDNLPKFGTRIDAAARAIERELRNFRQSFQSGLTEQGLG